MVEEKTIQESKSEAKKKTGETIRRKLTIRMMLVAVVSMALASYVGIMGIVRVQIHYQTDGLNAKPVNMFITMLIFCALIAAAAGITWLLARHASESLTRPLRELARDMKELRDGNLNIRATITSEDEVGELAAGFNEMADSIEEYITDLRTMSVESDLFRQELKLASRIRSNLLPFENPPFSDRTEFQLRSLLVPCFEMGGDFYDYFLIDRDHLCLVAANVGGKGVTASLFMSLARNKIRESATSIPSATPAKILEEVNTLLCAHNPADIYMSIWLGILTISTGEMQAVNTGFENPALQNGNRPYTLLRTEASPSLGAIPGLAFTDEVFTLNPGDTLFLYSDGVSEAQNEYGNHFGVEQLLSLLNFNASADGGEVLQTIRTEITSFTDTRDPSDDVMMVYLKYHGV